MLFDDHPARATPYTPIEVMPRMSSKPMLRSVICRGVVIGPTVPNGPRLKAGMVSEFPNGITEIELIANTTAMIGAAMYRVL